MATAYTRVTLIMLYICKSENICSTFSTIFLPPQKWLILSPDQKYYNKLIYNLQRFFLFLCWNLLSVALLTRAVWDFTPPPLLIIPSTICMNGVSETRTRTVSVLFFCNIFLRKLRWFLQFFIVFEDIIIFCHRELYFKIKHLSLGKFSWHLTSLSCNSYTEIFPSIHPSVFWHLPVFKSQFKQRHLDSSLCDPSLKGDPEALLGQSKYVISPCVLVLSCSFLPAEQKHKNSPKHSSQVHEPPQLAPFEQRLSPDTLQWKLVSAAFLLSTPSSRPYVRHPFRSTDW